MHAHCGWTCAAAWFAFCSIPVASAAELTKVEPRLVSTEGGTVVTFVGSGFAAGSKAGFDFGAVGTRLLVDQRVVDSSHIQGTCPSLTEGAHTGVVLNAAGTIIATCANCVDAAPPPTISRISPTQVYSDGSTSVTIYGTNFRSETAFTIGVNKIQNPTLNWEYTEASGHAPALGAGETPGVRDVIAEDSRGKAVLERGVTYVAAPKLTAVEPSLVSTAGGTVVTFVGSEFTGGMKGGISTDGTTFALLLDQQVVDSQHIRGTTPALSAGTHTAAVLKADGTLAASCANCVEAAAPPTISSVTPTQVYADGTTQVTIHGANFRSETVFTIGLHQVQSPTVTATTATGFAPALGPTEPVGAKDVKAEDSRGQAVLASGVTYVAAAQLTAVEPSLVSTAGGTVVTFVGSGFTADMRAGISVGTTGTQLLVNQQLVDSQHIRGTTPALSQGTHTAVVVRVVDGTIAASCANCIEAAPPPTLSRVSPIQVYSDGSTQVTITGANFRSETVFTIGLHQVQGPTVTAGAATGFAPALGAGETLGSKDVIAEDSRGQAVLKSGVTYIAVPELTGIEPKYLEAEKPTEILVHGSGLTSNLQLYFDGGVGTPSVLVPTTFESATLLRGTAPAHARGKMDAILRLSSTAPELARLRDAVEYVAWWAPGPQEVEGTLVDGEAELRWVNPIAYSAIEVYRDGAYVKTLPGDAQLYTEAEGSGDGSQKAHFKLVGKLADGLSGMSQIEIAVMVCEPPADHGVADCGEKDFPLYGEHPPYGEGGTGAAQYSQGGGYHAVLIDAATREALFNARTHPLGYKEPNELVTGFTLLETATKLRIQIYAAKVMNGPDLSLRVLIQSVTTGVDRVQELVVPDVLLGADKDWDKDWMDFTYNTEKPDPDDPARVDPPLPAADYKVTVYAVGGGMVDTFYEVASDLSPDQILVPGVGCPPYPLVRVTDTTERNSNPQILEINQYGDSQPGDFPVTDPSGDYINPVMAYVKAETFDPDGDPIVDYKWTVKKGNTEFATILAVLHTASNTTNLTFPDYGYYFVDLEVGDNRCGKAKKTCMVKIYPTPPCFEEGPARFTYPFPQPNSEYYVPFLPGHMDSFSGIVPATFRAFVVDPGACDEDVAKTNWVQFGIFRPSSASPVTLTNGQLAVVDACIQEGERPEDCKQAKDSNDHTGKRFWQATFANMNLLPQDSYEQTTYMLKGRGSTNAVNDKPNKETEWTAWSPIQVYDASKDPVSPISKSEEINICPKPRYLDEPGTYSTGSYEPETGKYFFKNDSASPGDPATKHSFSDTPDTPLLAGGSMPPQSNGVGGVSQKGTLVMDKGVWEMASYKGGSDTTTFSSPVGGTKELLSGGGSGASDGSGGDCDFDPETLSFDFCQRDTLFSEDFETNLFQAILYSGFIGPIPVNISISVALGISILIETQIEAHLSAMPPFDNPFSADFWLLPQLDVCLAASLRADILFGIISIEAGFDFICHFFMPFHFGVDIAGFEAQYAILITMQIKLWLRLCAFWGLLCIPDLEFSILPLNPDDPPYELINEGNMDPYAVPAGCPEGDGGGLPDLRTILDRAGEGGGGPPPISMANPDYQITVASSPSGEVQVAAGRIFGDFRLGTIVRVIGQEWMWNVASVVSYDDYPGPAADPEILFLDEETVLLVWTQNFSNEDPTLQGLDPNGERTQSESSRILSNTEIVYKIGKVFVDANTKQGSIGWGTAPLVRLTDDRGSPDGPHGDGMVAIATAPAPASDPAAWAAWVRYETPDFLHPETGDPQIRYTNIYAQKIAVSGPAGSRTLISTAADEIDIEPAIARAPKTEALRIVWINDPLHDDLVTSNLGRAILCSTLSGSTWSAPAHVLDAASEATIPGILMPSLALKEPTYGMLAFTALPSNALESDAGLQNTRVVYTVKLLDGVWQPPLLVYKKCLSPLQAHSPRVQLPDPFTQNPHKPDFAVVMEETGPYGTRLGAGNALAMTFDGVGWSQPINLTPDDRVHQHVAATMTAAGEFIVVHQSPAVASRRMRALGLGRSAGPLIGDNLDLMTQSIRTVADPGISYCRISDPFAGAGAKVHATIGITNHGFASTPTESDQSTLAFKAVYLFPDGRRKEVLRVMCPVIKAGGETMFSFDLTMPRIPVKVSFEVDPVEGELDPADNVRVRSLGTQPPESPTAKFLRSPTNGEAVLLRWANAGIYDRILFYRDGKMVTELPGSATSHVDRGAGILTQPGLLARHEYALRGVRGQSRSIPATCIFVKPATGATFRRADANSDGNVDLSDGVFILNYLFTGGRKPQCLEAADTNDSGLVDISDGIYVLGFLFLGGKAPPAPYPACGYDLTPDELTCDTQPAYCRS